MTAAAPRTNPATTEATLAERHLPDGSTLVLLGTVGAPAFRIERRSPVGVETVYGTTFRDEAEDVLSAYDGYRPWHPAYLPRARAARDHADLTVAVHAGGVTPEDCVRGFLDSLGEGLREGSLDLTGRDGDRFDWGARFTSDKSMTAFKAAGRLVPGGAVMTWWA